MSSEQDDNLEVFTEEERLADQMHEARYAGLVLRIALIGLVALVFWLLAPSDAEVDDDLCAGMVDATREKLKEERPDVDLDQYEIACDAPREVGRGKNVRHYREIVIATPKEGSGLEQIWLDVEVSRTLKGFVKTRSVEFTSEP